ncbi:unnamed protein product [Allacma fusca]|uniref:Uncharacterized protein n=1 Tax=Allacma fusca TaxID=39272 RepID=A0A8J2P2D2_9HEXA|nr:unnamed protein product [Allacma fusca]
MNYTRKTIKVSLTFLIIGLRLACLVLRAERKPWIESSCQFLPLGTLRFQNLFQFSQKHLKLSRRYRRVDLAIEKIIWIRDRSVRQTKSMNNVAANNIFL